MSRYSAFKLKPSRKPKLVTQLERAGFLSLHWACIDPGCDEITVISAVDKESLELLGEATGEYIPCDKCGGVCRRFTDDPHSVEGMRRGAA